MPLRHPIRISLGVLCLVLGVIGAVLPVMQGWIFFLLAGVLFFPRHKYTHEVLRRGELHLPRFVAFLRRLGVGHHATEVTRDV